MTAEANWRKAMILVVEKGIPVPAIASALSYYDGYRSARLPAGQATCCRYSTTTLVRIPMSGWAGRGGRVASITCEV